MVCRHDKVCGTSLSSLGLVIPPLSNACKATSKTTRIMEVVSPYHRINFAASDPCVFLF